MIAAGVYELTPLKQYFRRRCHETVHSGFQYGLYCVGCCVALMVLLIPLGVMNIAAMAALAVVIFLEKLWRHGPILARIVGVAFLCLAILAPFQDWLLPGLHPMDDEQSM